MNYSFRATLLLLYFTTSMQPLLARQKLTVYFVGNSYVYTHDLPKMIKDIAITVGDTFIYSQHVPGGQTLATHDDEYFDPCINNIKAAEWDYVVLQEQSQRPAMMWNDFLLNTYYPARNFNTLVTDSTKCTDIMFYMTWGYKNGDPVICANLSKPPYNWPYYCTYNMMDSITRERYMVLADSFERTVSPVGAVKRYLRTNHPGIELYQADGSHPSFAGAYAAACCFYTALFKKDPTLITYTGSLSAADAATIRAAAKTVVYDSLAKWHLGINDLSAGFSHVVATGKKVTFTNTSSAKALSYSWDFGDGNSASQKNPVHTYAKMGTYQVKLTVSGPKGCSRTVWEEVIVTAPSGLEALNSNEIRIVPNPATHSITVSTCLALNGKIIIRDITGRLVLEEKAIGDEQQEINISALQKGLYMLAVYNADGQLFQRNFMKE
jgi:hypothetical protein